MIEVDGYGNKECWIDGHLHRDDGPAVEYVDVLKQWWIDGKLHRTDGSVIEFRMKKN